MAASSGSAAPPSLESLALHSYLVLLQDSCAVFVQICRLESRILASVRRNAIAVMRADLEDRVKAGTNIRQNMVDQIMDGKFPIASDYHNQYEPISSSSSGHGNLGGGGVSNGGSGGHFHNDAFYESEQDLKVMEEVATAGKRCNSVCCTGAFVAEAMLCVVLNADVKILDFDIRRRSRANKFKTHPFWNKNKLVRKYVPFQVPAVLAHYSRALRDADRATTAKLERLYVKGTEIPTREFATSRGFFDLLTSTQELTSYLKIAGAISQLAGSPSTSSSASTDGTKKEGPQYGAFSEHLILSLGSMFSSQSPGGFANLRELVLGREACNTSLRVSGGKDISTQLFKGIGSACPRLQVLDVSGSLCLSGECLLFMFFRDVYHALHKFAYLPQICSDPVTDRPVQNDVCDADDIKSHAELTYCPWCEDEWCQNGVREGLERSDIQTPVVDDRVVDGIRGMHGAHNARKYLMNVVTARDLVRSVEAPSRILRRPTGPKPWEEGFREPRPSPLRDCGAYWAEPTEQDGCHYEEYREAEGVINPIARSLRCLKLNVDALWPKHELVPFLLKVMPNVRSLGHASVVKGLKMIRDIVGLEGISAGNIEEMEFGFGRTRASGGWSGNGGDLGDFVDELGQHLYDENVENPEEKKEVLRKDVELVARHCPRLRRLDVYLYGERPYLQEGDATVWEPFADLLPDLREIHLVGHEWAESVALVAALGNRLRKLKLHLDGRGSLWTDGNRDFVPRLEEVLDLCPALEDLTLEFGIKRAHVSPSRSADDRSFPNLRSFRVEGFMTKSAFSYLWARSPRMRSLQVEQLALTDAFPQQQQQQANGSLDVEFDSAEVIKLLRSNPMRELRNLNVLLRVKDIEAAKVLIEGLPGVTSLGTVSIRVGLPAEDYPNQEQMLLGLAHVMQNMRQFKVYCAERKAQAGQKIYWKWERHGFLESIASIEQLNALIEPNA